MKILWQAFAFWFCVTVLTGFIYPAVIAAVGRAALPDKASGSLVSVDGRVVGSSLIAQPFQGPGYFWPRPLVMSNLSPTSAQLKTTIAERRKDWSARANVLPQHVPEELLTGSGSGLDPHISHEAARIQVATVAAARGFDEEKTKALLSLVDENVEGQQLHALGEARVNVLLLNLAVDKKFGTLKR